MKIEDIKPTISNEDAYKRGFYYVLLTQTEPDGPFLPITNFYKNASGRATMLQRVGESEQKSFDPMASK